MQLTASTIRYYNFDIAIDHTEDGYFVRVTDSPAGTTVEVFAPPLLPEEVQLMRVAAFQESEGTASQSEALQTLQAFGQALLALFPKSLRTVLQSSYRMAYEQRARLRIRLQLGDSPKLAALPWEYLYDPLRGEYCALSTYTPLVRYTKLMHHIRPLGLTTPLRMLVIIASPEGYPPRLMRRAVGYGCSIHSITWPLAANSLSNSYTSRPCSICSAVCARTIVTLSTLWGMVPMMNIPTTAY